MLGTVIISGLTCVSLIASILFKPQIGIGKKSVSTYWIVALAGALLLVLCGYISFSECWAGLTAAGDMNPLKILALFISMTLISVFLDEAGFFRYIAVKVLQRARASQKRLFLSLYLVVSALTVFTSNDIIILTFTPFILYFCKNAGVKALPYLIAEFVAANTWSMFFIVGNPTNIYLAATYGIGFFEYFEVMAVPTVFGGLTAFAALYLIFEKSLLVPLKSDSENAEIENKPLVALGLVHLCICTALLAVSSYVDIQMWLISVCCALSLFLCAAVYALAAKRKPDCILKSLARAPWELVPFVISMFAVVLALQKCGATLWISERLGSDYTVFKYGALSYLASNIVNNIPMSVLLSSVLSPLKGGALSAGIYATVVGSNLGAVLTPVGALAGIMWSSILKKHGEKMPYLSFVKYGALISVPTLAATLGGLFLMLSVLQV